MNILVSLEGVLSSETGHPIRSGVFLYYALAASHRVMIVTTRDRRDATHWLASHGIIDFDDIIDSSYGLEGEDLRKRQITYCRAQGGIELYIDSDPSMCAWVFEQGITAVVFAHPSYLPVAHRPDAPKKIRTWNEVENSIKKVNIAKSLDKRLNNEDSTMWEDL